MRSDILGGEFYKQKTLPSKADELEIEIKKLIAELSPENIEPMIDELLSNLTIASPYLMEMSTLIEIIVAYEKRTGCITGKLLLQLRKSNEINEINRLSNILSKLKNEEASNILVEKSNKSVVIQALGYFDDEISSAALVELLSHSDSSIRDTAFNALIDSRKTKTIPHLVKRLNNRDFYIRFNSAIVLAEFKEEVSGKVFIEGIKHENYKVRAKSAKSLGNINSKETKTLLIEALKDSVYFVRRSAAISLANSGFKEALPELFDALNHYRDPSIAESEVVFFDPEKPMETYKIIGLDEKSLERLGDEKAIKAWLLENRSYNYKPINTEVINALSHGNFNTEEVRKKLQEALERGNQFAATALAAFGVTEVVPNLISILDSEDYRTQLDEIMKLIANLINHDCCSDRGSIILDIINRLNDSNTHKNHYFGNRLAMVLMRVSSKYLVHYLPKLSTMLSTKMGQQVSWVIESTQANCKFYNYEVLNSSPPLIEMHPPSSTIINITGNVGIVNAQDVNIQGDQIGETK